MNLRPSGYEPDELPAAPSRDEYVGIYNFNIVMSSKFLYFLSMKKEKTKIVYAVLNWGLGHASRSLPIIRALTNEGYDLTIISDGRAFHLLSKELPNVKVLSLKGYNVNYTKNPLFLIFSIIFQLPKIIAGIIRERKFIKRFVEKENPSFIISDNCYGIYHKKCKSILISHQLRLKFPPIFAKLEFLTEYLNRFLIFRNYDKILVMDFREDLNLSGELSHSRKLLQDFRVEYIGPSADLMEVKTKEIKDFILIIISGPEPQRGIFENLVLEQAERLKQYKFIVILGKTEQKMFKKTDNLKIYSSMPRKSLMELMAEAKLVISRSGYSTVMELYLLNKKALLVPTPAQTEQEYLAKYYQKQNLYLYRKQSDLNLAKDIELALKFDSQQFKSIKRKLFNLKEYLHLNDKDDRVQEEN